MAAKHKLSRAHVKITTDLAPERLAEISKFVGENTKGDLAIGVNNVRFEGASQGRTNFSIRALNNIMELMTFHVDINGTSAGSEARSAIDVFRTRQQKMFLIPLGPKSMSGYKTYKRFMENLGTAVRAEDAQASVVVTEIAQ